MNNDFSDFLKIIETLIDSKKPNQQTKQAMNDAVNGNTNKHKSTEDIFKEFLKTKETKKEFNFKEHTIHAIANFVELYQQREELYDKRFKIDKEINPDFPNYIQIIDTKIENFILDYFDTIIYNLSGSEELISYIIYDLGIITWNDKEYKLKNKQELIEYLTEITK